MQIGDAELVQVIEVSGDVPERPGEPVGVTDVLDLPGPLVPVERIGPDRARSGFRLRRVSRLPRMYNGDIDRSIWRRRLFAGALALTVAGSLAACKTASTEERTGDAPVAAASSAPAPASFGPASFGKLTLTMSEKEALATGDLQTEPVATVLGKNVYSFVGGPKPDPKQMAKDEKLEKAVEEAEKSTDTSAAGSAKAAQAYADSTQRLVERLEAYLGAGGAAFRGGKLDSIAAPEDAATEAGIKRGSSLGEVKAAYGSKLKASGKNAFEVPVEGQEGWTMLFELKSGKVQYMSIGKAG